MKTIPIPCWWCGRLLMASGHATTTQGHLVHKVCKAPANQYLKPVTAQPSQSPYSLLPDDKDWPGE